MISFQEARQIVLDSTKDFGELVVPLTEAVGHVLAEDVVTDRDFPPFDRAMKDGIAIQLKNGTPQRQYTIQGIAAAGSPQQQLTSATHCVEIMTGAIVPEGADTVIMYEQLTIKDGVASLLEPVQLGQDIHYQGSDEPLGKKILSSGTLLSAAEIGVLASVGKSEVRVKRKPKVVLFSTGDELVPITQKPLPHQIRRSNAHTLKAALSNWGITADMQHVKDDRSAIEGALKAALATHDCILLSGGVSKGKYDHLPEVLHALGVHKEFHRVAQRPGKPFWFGQHKESNTTIFGFPGNPTSTFVNFHLYFVPWSRSCLGFEFSLATVYLEEHYENKSDLTRFELVKVRIAEGRLVARLVHGNGSGDLTSLVHANGFVQIEPDQTMRPGEQVPFIPTRRIV